MFNLLLLCGGPSLERGISLNSVRSFYDNIGNSETLKISVIFIDTYLNKYFVNETFLYSNTPSDFDFKLANEGQKLSEDEFLNALKKSDLVVPVMHGIYGEDGTIQKILEDNKIPFVASGKEACEKMYNKANAETEILKKHGFRSVPKLILNCKDEKAREKIAAFYEEYKLNNVVIKPVKGGSSFGVVLAKNLRECIEKALEQLQQYSEILLEQFCTGHEFTVMVLQNSKGAPVALIPTEIEVKTSSGSIARSGSQKNVKEKWSEEGFFTTRRKYLPTNETHYYNPPRFSRELIQKIRNEAEKLFEIVGAKDFVRIDGWILSSGEIYFSDFNPISGMEQNSFLFQQGAKVGFTHRSILEYILENSCRRQNLKFPGFHLENKKRVNVLLGGTTSERQVSLMSGSNVWLKLLNSKLYEPHPYLLTSQNNELKVLPLSYDIILNHTVEEIIYQHSMKKTYELEKTLVSIVREDLGLEDETSGDYISLEEFIENSKSQNAYVFLGLHGGLGEDGRIQKLLEDSKIKFNGSGSHASRICMDKYKTSEIVDSLSLTNLRGARKISVSVEELFQEASEEKLHNFWQSLTEKLESSKIVVKPQCDGCSTGVIVLSNEEELKNYIGFFKNKIDTAPPGSFKMHSGQLSIGIHNKQFLFEEYIEVDKIVISNNKIVYNEPTKWIELTIGVVENSGSYHALNPSITIADSGVLSLEEKFQGGMGVNITPPPEYIINSRLIEKLKSYVQKLCEKVNIKDYCRIDVFVNNSSGEIIIIEINTLPALSPSTVLFQQAGKENPPMNPLKFLEKIISNKF